MSDSTKKILLVDDEKDIIYILKNLLEEHFYSIEVDTADNGLAAFLKCQSNKYDLIITDHKMPFMTGAALAVALKSYENQNLNSNIVMISGFLDEDLKEKLRPRNIEFVSKPYEDTDLINLITPFLI